jgi:hypothetical protein
VPSDRRVKRPAALRGRHRETERHIQYQAISMSRSTE